MKHVKQLLTLSTFGVLCLVSCGQSYTHEKLNCDLKIYSADLNHNGVIDNDEKNLSWAESYDVLMGEISDNGKLNDAADAMNIDAGESQRASLARYEILHQAEEMLMDTGAVMPLYNYSDPYLLKQNVSGIYFTSLGCKYLDKLTKNGQSGQHFDVSVGTKADTLDPADNNDSATSNTINNCMRGLSYYDKGTEIEGQERTFSSELKWNDKLLVDEAPTITYKDGLPTYTFTIKQNNKQWSDGTDVKAIDFVYTWHRACSAYHGTWGFIFDCIQGYDAYSQLDKEKQKFWQDDPQGETAISGINIVNDYQFTVTLTYDCSFFQELCSFTAYAPLQKAKMATLDERGKEATLSTWWNNPKNWITNGPFKLSGINNKQTGTFDIVSNNENGCLAYSTYGATAGSISYHLIDDDSAMFMDYQRGKYDMVDSFPTGMTDKIIHDLPKEYRVATQVGNYYFFFNVNDNALDVTNDGSEEEREKRRANIRKGLIRLVNRLDMTDTIVKSGATDGNGFVSTGIEETCYPTTNANGEIVAARDSNGNTVGCTWHSRNKDQFSNWESGTYKSHWLQYRNNQKGGFWKSTEDDDVIAAADDKKQEVIMRGNVEGTDLEGKKLEGVKGGLEYIKEGIKGTNVTYNEKTGKFVNFPTITITTNTGTGHESLCERLQYLYSLYGINLKIETQEWTAFSQYIKTGNVAMGRNGWIADFSDARTYLELFTSTNSQNYAQLGKSKENGAYIHKSQ